MKTCVCCIYTVTQNLLNTANGEPTNFALPQAASLWIPEALTTVTSLPYIQLNLDRLNGERIERCIPNNIFPDKKQRKVEKQISRALQSENDPVSR